MREIRYAVRTLRSTPTLTITALLILGLGIGAITAIFTVAHHVLFRPLPFMDQERLVQFGTLGVLEFEAYREQSRSFESLVFYSAGSRDLQQVAEPERIAAVAAERGLFRLLGARPLAGRTFTDADPRNVAVVSEGFWRRRFAEKQPLDNWTIVLDREPYTVIGVMPASFQFPYNTTMTEVWIPADLPVTGNWFQRIDVAVGRLGRGVTIEMAQAELRTIAQRIEPLSRVTSGRMITMVPLTEVAVGRSRRSVLILFSAAAMVLLIACANVATLLLARAETRKHEVAVRTALGAGRARLLKQFLTESVLLALASSLVALAIASGGTRLLVTFAATQIPGAFQIGIDWTAFLFLLAIGLGTGVGFGLFPALHAINSSSNGVPHTLGRRSSQGPKPAAINNGLVVVEIALAFILVTSAGLLLRAFLHLEQAPAGIVARQVLTLRLETRGLLPPQTPRAETASTASMQGQYFRLIEERVRQIPGVRAAGFVTRLHVQSPGNTGQFTIAGRGSPADGGGLPVRLREASPGYFETLGIPLRAGRFFSERDTGIVVNEALVREHFPGEDPIGRVLNRGTIIGVVGDVRQRLRLPAEPEIFAPLAATSYSAATLVVNAQSRPEALVEPVRAAIRQVNQNQTVFDVRTMDDVLMSSHGDLNLSLWLIGLFAASALILCTAGIYGVISYGVTARRKEFGIRMALGAGTGRLFRLVLGRGVLLVGTGVLIGVGGALATTRFLAALLYEVTPADPVTFAATSLLLTAVAILACVNPAWRTIGLDPATVLRHE